MKNSLSTKKGLSMTQASSVSNLCNQRASDIKAEIDGVNNYSKSMSYNGSDLEIIPGVKMPDNIMELLEEKSKLHAAQAFLMENIKEKEKIMNKLKFKMFEPSIARPKEPKYATAKETDLVDGSWGVDQLTYAEQVKFINHQAYAAHIGQFIHKGGKLDLLRKELPHLPSVEFHELKAGQKDPVMVNKHHNAKDLLGLHEKLAKLHREHEAGVNYFKAKVKNLVSVENARIERENANLVRGLAQTNAETRREYEEAIKSYQEATLAESKEFEAKREEGIKEASAYRIELIAPFKETIDMFLEDEGKKD